jgi:hypothetical protein
MIMYLFVLCRSHTIVQIVQMCVNRWHPCVRNVPSDECRRNLMHCFNGERKERDKGMKGTKYRRKVGYE